MNKVLFIILLALASCSSLKKNNVEKSEDTSLIKTEVQPKTAIEQIEERLETLTTEALEKGGESVKYLSTDLFIKANDASLQGDAFSASILYKFVLKLNPKDLFLKKKYGLELIKVGQLAKALPLIKEVYKKSNKGKLEIGLLLAGIHTSLKDYEKAEKVYYQILKKDKKNEEACIFLAKSYISKSKKNKAMSLLSKCHKRNTKSGMFAYYKGQIHLKDNKRKLAKKEFKLSLGREPDLIQAILSLGLIAEDEKKFKTAKKHYRSGLDLVPDNQLFLSRLVNILFIEENYEEVIPYAQRLSDLSPDDLNLKVKLGILYSDVKMYDKSKEIFISLLKEVPDSDKVLYYLGALYQHTTELEKAVETYSRIDTKSSLFYDSNIQIAQILNNMALGSNESKSEDRFIAFIRSKSDNSEELEVDLGLILANYFDEKSDLSKAIDILESIESKSSFTSKHRYFMASLYEKNNQHNDSEKLIKKLLIADPTNAHALNLLGYSLLERGVRLDEAYNYISKAVKLLPKDGFIRDSLGWYYFKTKKYSKALKEMKLAYKLSNGDSVIVKHLGLIYQEMNKFELAKKYFVMALENSKLDEDRDSITKLLEELNEKRTPASSKNP